VGVGTLSYGLKTYMISQNALQATLGEYLQSEVVRRIYLPRTRVKKPLMRIAALVAYHHNGMDTDTPGRRVRSPSLPANTNRS
jgi:hypothetical protein